MATAQAEVIKVHGLSLYGEPKYDKNVTHLDYVNPQAPLGGMLRLTAPGTFNSLNPFIIKGDAAPEMMPTFATLLSRSGDEAFSVYGYVAEVIEFDENRRWVIFHLRPQAQFHDGTPIRADDVIASFETIRTKALPTFKTYYQNVVQVEKLDDFKVKFTFGPTPNRELILILGDFPLFPKKFLDAQDFEKADLTLPPGSGPYQLAAYELGRYIQLKRVDNWWGKNLFINKGRHNFEFIRTDYFRDMSVAFEAFKSHQTNFRREILAKNWMLDYNFPAAKRGEIVKEEIADLTPTASQNMVFNLRNPLFQDKRVRQAISYALDFEWLNKNLFHDAYVRVGSYFGNGELASTGIPQRLELDLLKPYKDQLPSELFDQPFKTPTTLAPQSARGNLEKAQKLLKEAGWQIRDGKLIHQKTQTTFKFEFLVFSAEFDKVLMPFLQNMKRLGMDVRLRLADYAQYAQRVDNHDFDMTVGVFSQSPSPGNEQRDYWKSSEADRVATRNLGGIKNPIVDALVELLIQAESRETLLAATHALDRVLLWNYYTIPLWTRNQWIAYWKELQYEKHPAYGVDMMAWWQDPTTLVSSSEVSPQLPSMPSQSRS